ncbi:hypothetical protein PHLCEN_2v12395 [Hermanssonia centrifuga]|uniref:Uncharacterized protein n=1 Tax=Hermanssonia centrifuga TaxID=98765 RepID=A0A2R6NH83_9APHY|nr:hypothetical protein PHLCEN_2v12395 [Hermanssonia centrifuga]
MTSRMTYSSDEVTLPTTDEWVSVLRLSSLWNFEFLRAKAINHLQPLITTDPLRALFLAMDGSLRLPSSQWQFPALVALVRRREPISQRDVEVLGIDAALKVGAIREKAFEIALGIGQIWDAKPGRNCFVSPTRATLDFTKEISEVFSLPVPLTSSANPLSL